MSGASVVQVAGLARVGGRGERRKKRWSRESHTEKYRNKSRHRGKQGKIKRSRREYREDTDRFNRK
jgi:hypothetical protein